MPLVLHRIICSMKKIITILLILIYSGSALGIVIDYHYCCSNLTNSTILNFGGHGGCKCNPAKMPSGCCKDRIICMKGDNHQPSQISFIALPGSFAIDVPGLQNTALLRHSFFVATVLTCNSVQQKYPQPLFLLHRVFRI